MMYVLFEVLLVGAAVKTVISESPSWFSGPKTTG
jgi:hypothetical protein